jgi:hypothetical protein
MHFHPEEERPGQNHVPMLSYATWSERFGADRYIAGKTITLDDKSYTVVGVLSAGFQFGTTAADFQALSQVDIWVPMTLDPQRLQRNAHMLYVIARLKPGVKLAQAQAEFGRLGGEPRAAVPGAKQGQTDRRRAAGRSGDEERSRGTRDIAWRSWTGAADRLRQRRQPAAKPHRLAEAARCSPRLTHPSDPA